MNPSPTIQNKPMAEVLRTVRTHIGALDPAGRTLSQDELLLVAGGLPMRTGCSQTWDKIDTGHPVPDSDRSF